MSAGDGGPAGGIPLPADALVVLVGASGSGKSTWAARHFRETEVVSSDRCRALVSDDEESQAVHREAFAVLYEIVRQRLSLGRRTVVDSTSLGEFSRRRLREIAARFEAPVHAVVHLVRTKRRRVRCTPSAGGRDTGRGASPPDGSRRPRQPEPHPTRSTAAP